MLIFFPSENEKRKRKRLIWTTFLRSFPHRIAPFSLGLDLLQMYELLSVHCDALVQKRSMR